MVTVCEMAEVIIELWDRENTIRLGFVAYVYI